MARWEWSASSRLREPRGHVRLSLRLSAPEDWELRDCVVVQRVGMTDLWISGTFVRRAGGEMGVRAGYSSVLLRHRWSSSK